MSNRYRNPFKLRASDRLENESSFLKMFSPYILDALLEKNKEEQLWNDIMFLRSSPGAGKTSILKLFEPNYLLTLIHNQSAPYYKEIIEYLKNLEVINSNKINIIGIYLSCARNYEVLEDLDISKGQKKRLFFALINARIIIFSLKGILNLFPNTELRDIEINANEFEFSYLDINFPSNGYKLFEWASNIEKQIFKAIDSFLPISESNIQGHDELFAFDIMRNVNISIKNSPLSVKLLYMFDDTHKLSKLQREYLLKYLLERRGNFSIWIAERLEALDEQENLKSFQNRDYNEINLEEFWYGSSKFKNIVANVSDKRALISSEDVKFFQELLESSLNETEFDSKFIQASERSFSRVKEIANFNKKYLPWISYLETEQSNLTNFNKAILAKQVEIIINRSLGKAQLTLDFPLSVEELKQKIGSDLISTSLYLLSVENKIPYYYSFEGLVKISSHNIDQFLTFAADLFELMLSKKIADKSPNLSATDQERIIKKVAESKWKEQSRLLPYSKSVINFIHNLATFCFKETNKPSAPYAPGVNGIAIKDSLNSKLLKTDAWEKDEIFIPLINVLSTCVSYNLLEVRQVRQGKENQNWTVYYLNRWICVKYNLPLSYGGWRPKNPNELLKWSK